MKEELGLDHFEGRSWIGLHRHALMTMMAFAFLQHRRLKAGGGKKNRARAASADPARYPADNHGRFPIPPARPMPTLQNPAQATSLGLPT